MLKNQLRMGEHIDMEEFYEFQKLTREKIIDNLKKNDLVALVGEKDCGKSVSVKNLIINPKEYKVIEFIGIPYNRYTDFGCFPTDQLKKYKTSTKIKEMTNSFAMDFMSTFANFSNLSFENMIETLLLKDDKEEIDAILGFFSNLTTKRDKYLFVFDEIEYFDTKSLLFLLRVIGLVARKQLTNLKIVVVLDTTMNGRQQIIDFEYLEKFSRIQIESPTDDDLKNLVDPTINLIARQVPIKYLRELGDNCKNISLYFNNKLEELSIDHKYIKRMVYSMSLLDDDVSDSELVIYLSDLTNYEIFQGLKALEENQFLNKIVIGEKNYYTVPALIKKSIRVIIPDYIATHRYELFVRQLEKEAPFNYQLKYTLYVKMNNYDNAHACAILAYCAAARGDILCSSEELSNFDKYLNASSYSSFYTTLKNAYRLYNNNLYNDCFTLIDEFLKKYHIDEKNQLYFAIYLPEFVLELIFLKEMCTGRIYSHSSDIVDKEIKLAEQAIFVAHSIVNEELELRIREERLLLKSYRSDQTNKYQRILYKEYFSICECYKKTMRQCNITTLARWEVRYASLLLKVNIISDVPDKKVILQEGFFIIERQKLNIPVKYIKAACNYFGDLMWRDEFNESYKILNEVIQFIKDRNEMYKWGVVFQMYIFVRLYKDEPENAEKLIVEYNEIYLNEVVKSKMHEPLICSSNYAILLTATSQINKARLLLEESLKSLNSSIGNYEKYLLQTNLAAVEYLSGNCERAIELELLCKKLIDGKKVPSFSYPYLQRRSSLMLDIFANNKPIKDVLEPLAPMQRLSTGYCSNNYTRAMLFSDINYWTD